ncbi:MAG: putative DNA binding domain-containing protein [Propionibacteriaceae bacterium]|jgi:ATP-dependent DNA helicase RecG|nr:putative DNA binding domain-containing protein [Propionibacteriaceae bacterium]
MDLSIVIAGLRATGSDDAHFEAKSAAGEFPESVAATLSAFANTPGGGVLILGLDESRAFAATGVYDAVACQKAVAAVARNGLEPSVAVTAETVDFEGATLVVVAVPEVGRQVKPVRVRRSGKAYLRQYDGDYPLSYQEEQALIADRGHPVFDHAPVDNATTADLDQTAVSRYLEDRRALSPALAPVSDEVVLLRTGVVDRLGQPTLAGLLALGVYPQQFFPNLAIQASLVDERLGRASRALDSAYLTGPVPVMLESAIQWVRRVTLQGIVSDPLTGAVEDRPDYPFEAVRELVANALIHRDLGPHALDAPITLRIDSRQLLVANPGGLLGLSVDALGKTPSHLRNGWLSEILRSARLSDGRRVVERLGSGIPTVLAAVAKAGLPPPVFHDYGVRFTVRVLARRGGQTTATPSQSPGSASGQRGEPHPTRAIVVSALREGGPATVRSLAETTGLTLFQVRHSLQRLRADGLVAETALDGKTREYRIA